MANVDITGLDKAEVLKALHDNTRPLGLGFLHAVEGGMPIEDARGMVNRAENDFGQIYFDYVLGRPVKTDLSGDSFNPALYDRDAGPGRAQRAVDALRKARG